MDQYLNDRGKRILSVLDELSAEYGISQAGISLAWLIQNERMTVPIASATSTEQLQAFQEATSVHLEQDALERLNQASAYQNQ